MRRLLLSAIVSVLLLPCFAQNAADDTVGRLSAKLDEYFEALKYESIDVKVQEMDFVIEACTDSLVRQFVAHKVYSHYADSRIMGDEDVAIRVFQKWYEAGTVKMADEAEYYAARLLADISKESLIGCPAPLLGLEAEDGTFVAFPGDSKRYKVLFFYDTECANCKIQTILLRNVFEDEDYPVDFFAVYTGSEREAWTSFVDSQMKINARHTQVFHLWDPASASGFPTKYGVVSTPKMFLVNPQGMIVGRGLDALALTAMLQQIFSERKLDYGSKQSSEFYASVFGDESQVSAEQVCGIVDYISKATLETADTLMFRQMSGDLLYYLSGKRGEAYKEGLKYLIDNNIHGRPDVWRTEDDSLKVIGMAEIYRDLLSKAAVGSRIANLEVHGTLLGGRRAKIGKFKLAKLPGKHNIILFYTSSCPNCMAEKAALEAMCKTIGKDRILLVNIDDCGAGEALFEKFDITTTPLLIMTDRRGTILRRYFSVL